VGCKRRNEESRSINMERTTRDLPTAAIRLWQPHNKNAVTMNPKPHNTLFAMFDSEDSGTVCNL